jgi:hypothetical protein
MFVRFRQTIRLQVSLIETRRVGGKVKHEHIAGLGTIDPALAVADRVAFWKGVHERLSRLSNRIDAAAQGKILGEVHARIPMVTVDELRAVQLENAEADQRFWSTMRDMNEETLDGNKALAVTVQARINTAQAGLEAASAEATAAAERVDKIKKGEDVPGGLNKPFDIEQFLREQFGWTTEDINNALDVAEIGRLGGMQALVDETVERFERSHRPATRAVLKRLRAAAPRQDA